MIKQEMCIELLIRRDVNIPGISGDTTSGHAGHLSWPKASGMIAFLWQSGH